MTDNAFQKVNEFFESYARALENFETKSMVHHHNVPVSFISEESVTVFTELSKLEGFFNQGTSYYKHYGIVHARPEIWSKRFWTERICKVKVHWKYFDKENQPLYECDYQYLLRLDKHEHWKIDVSVSLNEKERLEAWLTRRDEGETRA